MNVNIISCTTWVKRGVAAAVPDKVQLSASELENIIKSTHSEIEHLNNESDEEDLNDAEDEKNVKALVMDTVDAKDEFDFEKYDDESGEIRCDVSNLTVAGKDPLITIGDSEDEDSEKEDDIIKPDDNLVLLGHVEGDASILEVYVFNEMEDSFYCHHDIILPSFPLCIEWLNYDPSDTKPVNFCAIGNMTPIIEIWDLDLLDSLEPVFKLGKKGNKKKKIKSIGHKDAVLDLAWNSNYSHILASGSVDQTVLLWDLESGVPETKFNNFEEKVQSLQWHPKETHFLLTGAADKNVRLFDCKSYDSVKTWKVSGEVEKILWNHFEPNICFASTDNGYLECIDIRAEKVLWKNQIHEKEITGLSLSSLCPGFLVSASNDGVIKVWDVLDHENPELVCEKQGKVGAIQCLASSPNSPFVFSVGGEQKSENYKLFFFNKENEISERFKSRTLVDFSSKNETDKIKKNENNLDLTNSLQNMEIDEASEENVQTISTKKVNRKKLKNKSTKNMK